MHAGGCGFINLMHLDIRTYIGMNCGVMGGTPRHRVHLTRAAAAGGRRFGVPRFRPGPAECETSCFRCNAPHPSKLMLWRHLLSEFLQICCQDRLWGPLRRFGRAD